MPTASGAEAATAAEVATAAYHSEMIHVALLIFVFMV